MVWLQEWVKHEEVVVVVPLEPLELLVVEGVVHYAAAGVYFLQVSSLHLDLHRPRWEVLEVFQQLLASLPAFEDAVHQRLKPFDSGQLPIEGVSVWWAKSHSGQDVHSLDQLDKVLRDVEAEGVARSGGMPIVPLLEVGRCFLLCLFGESAEFVSSLVLLVVGRVRRELASQSVVFPDQVQVQLGVALQSCLILFVQIQYEIVELSEVVDGVEQPVHIGACQRHRWEVPEPVGQLLQHGYTALLQHIQ